MSTEIDIGIKHLTDLQVLGRGGFSVVYAATDTRFDRRVAVKVLRPFGSESDRKKFERECRVMGRLSSHENVVALYEAGFADDESPFMIMELVDGGSLDDLLAARGSIPWAEAVDYVVQAARAIDYAHRSDVLHRDVKPANILLDDGVAKLTDFGISGLGVSGQTSSTHVAASWLHAPPETFPNKRDARSDVYSLGSTLYTLIVGNPPLWRSDDDSLDTIMYRVLHEAPPSVSADLAPPTLDHLLARTLAKDPMARPQTAHQLIQELVGVRPGVLAHRPARRVSPAVLAAVGALLAVLLGGATLLAARLGASDPSGDETQLPAGVASGEPGLADVAVDEAPTITTAPTTTAPTTTAPTTTAPTITTASTAAEPTTTAAPAVERFEGSLSSDAAIDELDAFFSARRNRIVELELDLVVGPDDYFQEADGQTTILFRTDCVDGEAPSFATCSSGYQIVLTEESDGISGLSRVRGDTYRLTGFFAVGQASGPNQGILSQLLDPVAPEEL